MPEQNSEKKSKKVTLASVRYAFNNIIWPRRYMLLIGLILIIINRISGLVLPGSTKYLIDEVISKNNFSLLYILLTVVALAIAIQAVTSFFLTRLLSVEAQFLISELRSQVQKHIIRLPIRFFDNTKAGALVSRIMTDVEGVRNLVGTGLVQLFGGMLTAVIALIILLRINAELTLYAVVPLLLFGLISLKAFGYIRPIFRERGKINADVTGRLTESLGGIRVIKGFNAEEQEIRVFEGGVDRLFRNVKKSLTSTSLVTSAATLLLGITSVIIMGFGGTKIIQQTMTIGDFFAFTLYLGFMIAPIVQMGNIGSQITEAFAGLDRMEEIFNVQKEGEEEKRQIVLNAVKGDISFKNVSFAYERGNMILHDISFEVPTGTMTALVGSSGSGKTTIAGLAASFLQPDAGNIYIDNQNLAEIKLDSFRKNLGVVLQDDFLFEGTIRENILFARPDAHEKDLRTAIAAAHVKEFTDRFEKGIDTLIGERGVKLSGGQRQRVAIARALLADPRLLILDEATSQLDTESERYVQEAIDRLMRGRTVFVIAHRLSTVKHATKIIVLDKNRIVDMGNHQGLMERGGIYKRLYDMQFRDEY